VSFLTDAEALLTFVLISISKFYLAMSVVEAAERILFALWVYN
jgi:hypothetical protein